ncbi:ligand-gated channel [Aliidongia dinghuensis]|uniref:Ligand-gated channel n=1 Tax=Aliidongia dinghuensis TaxID=1867774 RepID=A0A8J3E649_9PROT|nr:TonB-dependent siderophore receptor [Aliidongia dinghuensis]GGF26901.1 ligand-gated channel [Aliidongia dinghuensis]
MRALDSAESSLRRPSFLGLSQPALAATTVCMTSAATLSGAFAQTVTASQDPPQGDGKAEQITVTGVRALVNDKLPTGLQDAPQSINVIDQQLLKDQGTTRLQDALKNVPGITFNSGEGAARGDTVNLRGFSAFNDFFLDGIRDAAVYTRDSFDLDQVEVLKGPSAVLFGRGSTGGVINQVSKAPTLAPLYAGTVSAGTNSLFRGTADVNEPLTATSAIRLNAMAESSDVADRDIAHNERWGVAPSYALGLGTPTTLTFSYLHQEENNVPDFGIPFINGQPAPVSRSSFYGLTSDQNTARDDIATIRVRHEFSRALSVSDTLRLASYMFGYRFNSPNFGATAPTATTPLSAIRVGHDEPSSQGAQTNLTNQTDVTARFATGPVDHIVTVGAEFSRQTSNIGRFNNPFNKNNNFIPMTPLLSPDPNEVAPPEGIASQQNTTAYSSAGYLTDTIQIGPYVDVIGGVRYDRFAASYNQYTLATATTLHLDHVDHETSPRAAIVIKPDDTQSYYFSYGTSFDPSAEALTLTTKTAGLSPVEAKTYEVGGKTSWLGGMFNVTGALFHTEVDNAQTNDPDNPTITTLAGDQRVRGFELGINGYITPAWEIYAGYTYLDAKTIRSGTAAFVGKVLQNVARNSGSLFTEYNINDDWMVGGGANWVGHRFADFGEQANLPGYVTFNAVASYQLNDNVKLQVNATNLLDKKYYDAAYYTSAAENHVVPGAGRTVIFSTAFTF